MAGVFAFGFVMIACIQIVFAIAQISGRYLHINDRVRDTILRMFKKLRKFFVLVDVAYVVCALFVLFFSDIRTFMFEVVSADSILMARRVLIGIFGTPSVMTALIALILGIVDTFALFVALAVACCVVVAIAVPFTLEEEIVSADDDAQDDSENTFLVEKPFCKNLRLNN